MINHLKYTTNELKAKIKADKDIDEKVKEEEEKKPVVSNDAFCLADMLTELKKEMMLKRRSE